jgi:hypothetical protein
MRLVAGVAILALAVASLGYLVAPPRTPDGYRERAAKRAKTLRSQASCEESITGRGQVEQRCLVLASLVRCPDEGPQQCVHLGVSLAFVPAAAACPRGRSPGSSA